MLFSSHMLFKCSLLQFIKKLTTRCTFLPNFKFCIQTSKKLCYQARKGLWNFSKISSSQHYLYSFPFFQKYYKHPIYSPSFHHLPRLIILLLPKKVMGTSILKIQIKNYVRKKNPQMIWIHLLKKKKKEGNEGRSQFDG